MPVHERIKMVCIFSTYKHVKFESLTYLLPSFDKMEVIEYFI